MGPTGLDQYMMAVVPAPKDSPFYKVIEEHLTDDQRKEMEAYEPGYPNYVPSAYISGWSYGNAVPDPLFTALSAELGFTPTPASPSFQITKAPNGYSIGATIFYWRKANAIHRWFVETVQNGVDECQPSVVRQGVLLDLIDRCERIMAAPESEKAEVAKELLETQSGFFFGSTEYDEWYFEDIKGTAEGLKVAVEKAAPKSTHFVYQSSW